MSFQTSSFHHCLLFSIFSVFISSAHTHMIRGKKFETISAAFNCRVENLWVFFWRFGLFWYSWKSDWNVVLHLRKSAVSTEPQHLHFEKHRCNLLAKWSKHFLNSSAPTATFPLLDPFSVLLRIKKYISERPPPFLLFTPLPPYHIFLFLG